ncbi:1,4-dihydroxy-2-naphthoate polyprenyltransferase [Cecembia lonarensis]|uniref:1,4-dihydroxy-2-naphthoate octaprenyltransferase n=1 Tax=Cecembia lonarensis (strain CCUG 58316 / KCTC 22772 / LW9) TaxID=1225176 RepID=K1KSS8_CECL9|nr:1,4-dihydroxy-2-naphthoate polyprenyltransferase [Cecembia lonarensis]EKB47215.1 1,4-dihydroxy-2-naphthoate octaprenyltransferase [Cecembia lonarensis LW9]
MEVALKSKKQAWLHAIRLRTLPLALSSIFMGSFLAAYTEKFRWEVLLLAALTTIFLQILSNLANDYGDSVHGADSADRLGPVRAVQAGVISLEEMKRAMYLLAGLSFLTGLGLIYVAVQNWLTFLIFLFLGLAAIWAAISYTSGKKPYGYVGLGDISVFLFFGILGVAGTFFLHSLNFSWSVMLPAISLGCFSTAVLNINNIRDIDSDKMAGKKSIPVRIGRRKAVMYNWFLIFLGNASLLAFSLQQGTWNALLALLVLPFMIGVGKAVQNKTKAHELDPYLKKMAISTLFWVILFGIGLLF